MLISVIVNTVGLLWVPGCWSSSFKQSTVLWNEDQNDAGTDREHIKRFMLHVQICVNANNKQFPVF